MSQQGPGQMMPPGPPPATLSHQPVMSDGASHQGAGQLQPWQGAPTQRGHPFEEEVQARVLQEQEADMQLALRSG